MNNHTHTHNERVFIVNCLEKKWYVFECGKFNGLNVKVYRVLARNLAHATRIARKNGMFVIDCLGEWDRKKS